MIGAVIKGVASVASSFLGGGSRSSGSSQQQVAPIGRQDLPIGNMMKPQDPQKGDPAKVTDPNMIYQNWVDRMKEFAGD